MRFPTFHKHLLCFLGATVWGGYISVPAHALPASASQWTVQANAQFRTVTSETREVSELDESFGPSALIFQVRPVAPQQVKMFVAAAIAQEYFPCANGPLRLNVAHTAFQTNMGISLENPLCQKGFLIVHSTPNQAGAVENLVKKAAAEHGVLQLQQGQRLLTLTPIPFSSWQNFTQRLP